MEEAFGKNVEVKQKGWNVLEFSEQKKDRRFFWRG